MSEKMGDVGEARCIWTDAAQKRYLLRGGSGAHSRCHRGQRGHLLFKPLAISSTSNAAMRSHSVNAERTSASFIREKFQRRLYSTLGCSLAGQDGQVGKQQQAKSFVPRSWSTSARSKDDKRMTVRKRATRRSARQWDGETERWRGGEEDRAGETDRSNAIP